MAVAIDTVIANASTERSIEKLNSIGIGNTVDPNPDSAVPGPPGNQESERAAGDRQQQRFRQQLPEQPGAAGADRRPNRELALPHGAPRQQQVGDVAARDQQHQADRRQQARARGPDVTIEHGMKADARHRHDARRHAFVRGRVLCGQPRKDRVGLRAHFFDRSAFGEPALDEQPSMCRDARGG